MLRVSNRQITATFIQQIFENKQGLETTRQQLTTGLEVAKPSDDPTRVNTITQFNRVVNRLERHETRIASVLSNARAQEVAIQSAEDITIRLQELATQAANDTFGQPQREQMAVEVFELRDALVGLGNTQYRGAYLFGGLDDDDPPFDALTYVNSPGAGTAAEQRYIFDAEPGTSGTRNVQITESDTVRINTPGDQIFQGAISAAERLGRALLGYETLPPAPADPDGTGVQWNLPNDQGLQTAATRSLIDTLENALNDDLIRERGSLGSRMNAMETSLQINVDVRFTTNEFRSLIQDADQVEAASNFANLQIGLQALLSTGTRINELSLLNYL